MPLKRFESSINVVQAAERRICNIFKNGLPVYFSFSGGKDSLVLAQLIMNLIQQGKINPQQLTVNFIDEEAIFPCVEKIVLNWRKRFMLVGAKFEWYCLEVKHYNCFNQLENDESFICWDRYKKDVWVRQPPSFAIMSHYLLKARINTYQQFLNLRCSNGITIIGIRTAESIQRLKNIAVMTSEGKSFNKSFNIFPIYDWKDKDVWLYLKEQKIEIPDIYLYMWQTGRKKNRLRVSQFFSVDTAIILVKMNEFYPDLIERVVKREPNAYLAALYWDTEMFGRNSRNRAKTEVTDIKKDYKNELINLFSNIDKYFKTEHQQYIAKSYKKMFFKIHNIADNRQFKFMYEALMAGDPKLRNLRALYIKTFKNYADKGVSQWNS